MVLIYRKSQHRMIQPSDIATGRKSKHKFNPTSEYIAEATKEFLRDGGRITKLAHEEPSRYYENIFDLDDDV